MSLRVLVVDDEPPARRKVLAHLGRIPDVEVVGEAADGLEAVTAIRELDPDLVFLDIQMPGLDGFEVVEAVGSDAMPPVVFVTAFDEYAVRAFDVEAVDYLLKPFDEERFRSAFGRALERVDARGPGAGLEQLERLLGTVGRDRPLKRLVVSERSRIILVPLRDVTHFSAEGNYVRAHTATASHLIRDTLARLEGRLDPEQFARIHRSHIVAIDAVSQLEPWTHGDCRVLLASGEQLRMSRRYKDRLLN